jgi:hypothetical protein
MDCSNVGGGQAAYPATCARDKPDSSETVRRRECAASRVDFAI